MLQYDGVSSIWHDWSVYWFCGFYRPPPFIRVKNLISTPMTYLPFHATTFDLIEAVVLWGTRISTIGSEVFTATCILWCLNFMANLIQKIYYFGFAFGTFYRNYCHSYVKSFFIRFVAIVILLSQLLIEGCQVVYTNRNQIFTKMNAFRNYIGSHFVL